MATRQVIIPAFRAPGSDTPAPVRVRFGLVTPWRRPVIGYTGALAIMGTLEVLTGPDPIAVELHTTPSIAPATRWRVEIGRPDAPEAAVDCWLGDGADPVPLAELLAAEAPAGAPPVDSDILARLDALEANQLPAGAPGQILIYGPGGWAPSDTLPIG